MSDPAGWGLLLVAVVVFACYSGLNKRLQASAAERRRQHRELMDALNILPDEFDQMKTYLNRIDENTKPPRSAEDLGRLGQIIEDALHRSQD